LAPDASPLQLVRQLYLVYLPTHESLLALTQAFDGQRRLLLCNVVEVLDNGWYRLGCSLDILDTHYQAADLEAAEAAY
ncbi:8911_t:CDS:2, partial [Paraglomus occultum]